MTTELIRLWPGDSIGVNPEKLYDADGCVIIRITRGPAYAKAHAKPNRSAGESATRRWFSEGEIDESADEIVRRVKAAKPAKKKGAKK